MYCRPTNLWTAVVVPDDGDKGIANICTGPVGRVLHGSIAGDGSAMNPTYRYAAGTHTFYRLQLAKGPVELVKAARKAAEEEIANAYGKLMFLNYRDTGYAGLKDLYGKAVAEMFEGRNEFNRVVLAEGNRALGLYARAASLYGPGPGPCQGGFRGPGAGADEPRGPGVAPLRRQLGRVGYGRRQGALTCGGGQTYFFSKKVGLTPS